MFVRIDLSDRSNLTEMLGVLRYKYQVSPSYFSQTVESPVTDAEKAAKKKTRETSQRLRSFYFLSIAAVMAQAHGIENVYINENGIMAIHLPMDPARASTFSTRTAYPPYLNVLQGVLSRWLGHTIKIKNQFSLKTKAEMISVGANEGLQAGLKRAVSCAHAATIQQTVKRQGSKDYLMASTASDYHCGYCFPCILRRISMWKAGLADQDVNYACDPFKVLPMVPQISTTLSMRRLPQFLGCFV